MHKEKEQLVQDYHLKKSPLLKDKIIVAYTPLVEYIARKLAFQKDDIPDLAQVGTIGLLKSLENFDPSKEVAFSTFASSNIIGEIKHYLRDKSHIVKLPRKLQETYIKIRQYTKYATQEHGKAPTVRDIANNLEITEEEVLESMEAGHSTQVVSLDKPLYRSGSKSSGQEQFTLIDSLGIDFKDEKLLNKETLQQAMLDLSDREIKIIQLRFYEGLTQKEIAQRLELSQMHISRLLNSAMDQLKKVLSKYLT